MITDKEYPATHSMSTAWYIVDEDGNVGLVDVDDNGPSIKGYREECLADLIFHEDNIDVQSKIEFSEEQIQELLSPYDEKSDNVLPYNTVVKIDILKKDRFCELIKNNDIKLTVVISEKFGYYGIEATDYESDEAPTFGIMQKEGIIKNLYRRQDYYIDDISRDENGVITYDNDFSSCPFYVYGTGYYNHHHQVRTSIPKHPVKIEQMPECLADKIVKVPLKFSEKPTFQIAEYIPFNNLWSVLQSRCFSYYYMELNDGSWGYIMDNIDDKYPMPKMFHICGYNDMETVGFKACSFAENDTLYISIMDDYSWLEKTTQKERIESFAEKKSIVEYGIDLINPYLIVIDDGMLDAISQFYIIQDDNISIGGESFPMMLKSALEINEQRIKEICQLPYRGRKLPKVIRQTDLKTE